MVTEKIPLGSMRKGWTWVRCSIGFGRLAVIAASLKVRAERLVCDQLVAMIPIKLLGMMRLDVVRHVVPLGPKKRGLTFAPFHDQGGRLLRKMQAFPW